MKIKDLKEIIKNFNDECRVEFQDKEGKRHEITNVRDDNCLLFWTMILSEEDLNRRRNGQKIIWQK